MQAILTEQKYLKQLVRGYLELKIQPDPFYVKIITAMEQDQQSLFIIMPFSPEIALLPILDKQIRWCLKTSKNATTFIICQNGIKVDKILKYTTPLIQLSIKILKPAEFLSSKITEEIFSIVVIDDGIEEIEEISQLIEQEMEEKVLYRNLIVVKGDKPQIMSWSQGQV